MQEESRAKLSVLAMGVTWGTFLFLLIFVISIWCSLTGFGKGFLDLFNTLNPNPYQIDYSYSLSTWGNFTANIPGILINGFYALVDGLAVGFILGGLYNFYAKIFDRKKKKQENVQTETTTGTQPGSN